MLAYYTILHSEQMQVNFLLVSMFPIPSKQHYSTIIVAIIRASGPTFSNKFANASSTPRQNVG